MPWIRFSLLFLFLVSTASCNRSAKGTFPSGFDVKVMFLGGSGEGQDFPNQITRLMIKVTPYPSTVAGGDCDCSGTRCYKIYEADPALGIVRLDDFNGDGTFEEAFMENLPYGCPMALEVFAYQNNSPRVTFYGRVDGVTLTRGKRLFLKMNLYLKNSTPIELNQGDYPVAVFGHTATRLDRGNLRDYRVLIAGGFSDIKKLSDVECENYATIDDTNCPAPYTHGDCFQCYRATATKDLFLFEQGSGKILKPMMPGVPPIPVTLAAARAFHTAVQLADGRVLIAGGVDRAVFVFYNNDVVDGDEMQDAGWEILNIKPDQGVGFQGALRSFELFNPELNQDREDLDRDGDFERGGMQQLIGSEVPMTTARFLQAAVFAPWQYDEDPIKEKIVLQFGGINVEPIDASIASHTVEIFQVTEDGNAQFSTTPVPPNLYGQRAFPAAAIGSRAGATETDRVLWIFGGIPYPGRAATEAEANNAVIEQWVRNTDGTYTRSAAAPPASQPGYVRLFADAITLPNPQTLADDGSLIMVAGWYGARCATVGGHGTPTYDYATTPTYICDSSDVSNNLLVKVKENPPAFSAGPSPASDTRYALGSTILLSCSEGARGNWVLQSGGIADTHFNLSTIGDGGAIALYRPKEGDAANPYVGVTTTSTALKSPRMWHRAVELKGGSVLFVGGVEFDLDAGDASIIDTVEILPFEGQCGDCNFESDSNFLGFETLFCCPQDCPFTVP
jgi:hypothetical protein